MKLIFIADIMGKPGRKALDRLLPDLIAAEAPDLVVANGENAAGGVGITPKIAADLLGRGIDLLTGGNHSFDNKEGAQYLEGAERVIRPLNYPDSNPGRGKAILPLPGGAELLVLNLIGRVFMAPVDCPFRSAERELESWAGRGPVFVDFHAEATSEKIALARFLDGRVSALIGTHTHVQTSDARVLPGGSAILTDAGMTGSHGGVIGIETELVVQRFLTQTLRRFKLCEDDLRLQGAVVEIEEDSWRSRDIRAFDIPLGD
jgi:metallophosphoesterase (TIGR00282 family)